ncbi:MAG: hypothetical protein PUB75_02680 [Firmicutes bacterium]|nr:hypothetical protein [Bacillota bacterium]
MLDNRASREGLDKEQEKEVNRAKARKLTLILGIVSVVLVLAMMSQILL